jgi:hypothetical protein
MKNQKQGLIVAGILFWLGMFSVIVYQEKGQMPPLLIIAALVICLIGGVFFWGCMSLFLKFAIKYSGTNLLQPKQRTKLERVISLLSILFAAGPVFYVLSLEENYLWPILVSSFPAFLLFSPLLSKPHGEDRLLARSLGSVLGGLFVCSLVHQYFIVGVLSFPSIHTLFVSVGSSLSWCISYLLSLQANRPNPSFKRDA